MLRFVWNARNDFADMKSRTRVYSWGSHMTALLICLFGKKYVAHKQHMPCRKDVKRQFIASTSKPNIQRGKEAAKQGGGTGGKRFSCFEQTFCQRSNKDAFGTWRQQSVRNWPTEETKEKNKGLTGYIKLDVSLAPPSPQHLQICVLPNKYTCPVDANPHHKHLKTSKIFKNDRKCRPFYPEKIGSIGSIGILTLACRNISNLTEDIAQWSIEAALGRSHTCIPRRNEIWLQPRTGEAPWHPSNRNHQYFIPWIMSPLNWQTLPE